MKTTIYLLLILSFLGCKKDDSTEGKLTGVWLFKEGRYGTGNAAEQLVVKADPVRPIHLYLKKDGTFSIDAQPRLISLQVQLQSYDRYEVHPNNEILFYNSTNAEKLVCNMELEKDLAFYQPGCREGCSNIFIRSY